MRTDHIFFKVFQTYPQTLFELVGQAPSSSYEFKSVEVKETALTIDGVFVPANPEQPIWFAEFQFQTDRDIYWRLCTEMLLYLREHARDSDWRAVLIFPRRGLDVSVSPVLQPLVACPQFQRVYIDELPELPDASLGLALVQLVVEDEASFIPQVRTLLQRTRQSLPPGEVQRQALELIETLIVYKLEYSREELEAMFRLDDLKETRYFRDVRQEAAQEHARNMTLRLLNHRLGDLPVDVTERVSLLSTPILDELSLALLNFNGPAELLAWLDSHC